MWVIRKFQGSKCKGWQTRAILKNLSEISLSKNHGLSENATFPEKKENCKCSPAAHFWRYAYDLRHGSQY